MPCLVHEAFCVARSEEKWFHIPPKKKLASCEVAGAVEISFPKPLCAASVSTSTKIELTTYRRSANTLPQCKSAFTQLRRVAPPPECHTQVTIALRSRAFCACRHAAQPLSVRILPITAVSQNRDRDTTY